jgi:hypothetical protein
MKAIALLLVLGLTGCTIQELQDLKRLLTRHRGLLASVGE